MKGWIESNAGCKSLLDGNFLIFEWRYIILALSFLECGSFNELGKHGAQRPLKKTLVY